MLGRFGHHPDPAVDFCVEVDELAGLVEDVKAGIEPNKAEVERRIFRAAMFKVGGDTHAVAARKRLLEIESAIGAA